MTARAGRGDMAAPCTRFVDGRLRHRPGTHHMHATGEFEVGIKPQQPDNPEAQAAGISRLSLDKRFHGALEGRSTGEMLAFGDGRTSGAYVALEKFTGTLDGRSGSFALMHRAGMRLGATEGWTVTVVRESGTDALQGVYGEMSITIVDGKHLYDFSYTLLQPA